MKHPAQRFAELRAAYDAAELEARAARTAMNAANEKQREIVREWWYRDLAPGTVVVRDRRVGREFYAVCRLAYEDALPRNAHALLPAVIVRKKTKGGWHATETTLWSGDYRIATEADDPPGPPAEVIP